MTWLDDVARANPEYVASLYEAYRRDPGSVDERWALLFAGYEWARAGAGPDIADLVHSYRELGHLVADLDPLGGSPRTHPLLRLEELGLREPDLDRVVDWTPLHGGGRGPLRGLLHALAETYAGTLGVEYLGISDKARRGWLQGRMEPRRNHPELSAADRRALLERLLDAEMFEQFLHARYAGQKRFSLEGGEALIPLLDTLIDEAAGLGVEEMVLGMAHRGRLNVLAHVLGKPAAMIFAEFEGALLPEDVQGDGDVKYHLGYSHDRPTSAGGARDRRDRPAWRARCLRRSGSPPPGGSDSARARDGRRRRVVPVLLHGDAAFAGQGVVYETLALSSLTGYTTGGTVHVIVDNQLGFTTSPAEYLFARYPSDLAHVLHAPVFHVNADDPEAAVQAARLAAGYRQAFGADVFIHLVCYRRRGHNEGDDPTLTQPVMYEQIRNHPTVVALYTKRLVDAGVLDEAQVSTLRQHRRAALEAAQATARGEMPRQQIFAFGGVWQGLGWAGDDWSADTRVPLERLRAIADGLVRWPGDFTPHTRLAKLLEERHERVQRGGAIDWGTAELLAYGSLLLEGTPVRLSGQDSVRGTFSHRHAALVDATDGRAWVPLDHLADDQARMEAVNSPLSEAAVLGFEYGVSSGDPRRLVVWEAQFGDFANGAQTVIDEFLASGESKWQRMSGLVLLLPHGYEGQGPNHSSARLERFLQLGAERNLQVIVPTTPAQLFHALRRQIHRPFRKPLVVLSPKSLLRYAPSYSPLAELAEGGFQLVLDDPRAPATVRRVIVCAGRIFHALDAARAEAGRAEVALVRVEQLYPFPAAELATALGRYASAAEVCWVQEEPANQGAWAFVRPLISPLLRPEVRFSYIGRDEAASPATGLYPIHQAEERAILEQALEG